LAVKLVIAFHLYEVEC